LSSEEGSAISEERILVVNMKQLVRVPRTQRAPRASRLLQSIIARVTKANEVKISNEVNEILWSRGIEKPPRKIKVKLVKDEEGIVTAFPA
jgi:large subunit ribosomal protein L31e